jgi:hypothetical protein
MPKWEWATGDPCRSGNSPPLVGYGPAWNADRPLLGRAVRLSGNGFSSDGAGAHEFLTPSDTPTAASAKGRHSAGRNRESGNPRFPIRPGTGNGAPGPIGRRGKSGNRGDTLSCEYSRHDPGLHVALRPSNADSDLPPPSELPRTGRWRMKTVTRRWRTLGRTMRTISTQTMMPRHVHNKDPSPLSTYAHADPAGNLAQSREADDSSMFPLSDPAMRRSEYEPAAGPGRRMLPVRAP